MRRGGTLRLAIDLIHFPAQVRLLRAAPLPDDVVNLLRIAAGDEEATRAGAALAARSQQAVREAAAFFVEQILLYPGADSYRVLAAKPDASYAELRRNMAILLRWLHPDRDRCGERTIFAARVTRAWDDVKTKERRAAYDRLQSLKEADKILNRRSAGSRLKSAGFEGGRGHVRRQSGSGFDQRRGFIRAHRRGGLVSRILTLLLGRTAL